jgi:hypothetical protein
MLPERVDSVKWIKGHVANNIYSMCGGDTIDCVLNHLGNMATQEELRDAVRKCCANARAGETLENGYVVAEVNERAVVALLELLLMRPHHLKHIRATKIQAMINKISERRSTKH